jgi:hypothetical protein
MNKQKVEIINSVHELRDTHRWQNPKASLARGIGKPVGPEMACGARFSDICHLQNWH